MQPKEIYIHFTTITTNSSIVILILSMVKGNVLTTNADRRNSTLSRLTQSELQHPMFASLYVFTQPEFQQIHSRGQKEKTLGLEQ